MRRLRAVSWATAVILESWFRLLWKRHSYEVLPVPGIKDLDMDGVLAFS